MYVEREKGLERVVSVAEFSLALACLDVTIVLKTREDWTRCPFAINKSIDNRCCQFQRPTEVPSSRKAYISTFNSSQL